MATVAVRADSTQQAAPRQRQVNRTPLPASGPRRVMRLLAATPPGSTRARHVARWLRAVEEHPDAAPLRADSTRTLRAVAWHLALAARPDGTTAPGWEALVERTGMSRRTVARWLAWLRERGLLGVVETGSTEATRGRAAALDDEGNRAAVYLLCERRTAPSEEQPAQPPGKHHCRSEGVYEHGTPRMTPGGSRPNAGARGTSRSGSPLRGPDWPRAARTRTRGDELRAAEALRAASTDLRGLSGRHLRSLIRDRLRAGWTVADLLHAIDHAPDGTERTWTTRTNAPAGWLRWRLAAWDGCEPPSVVADRDRAADRAAADRRRQQYAETRAAAAEVVGAARPEVREVLARLAAKRRRGDAAHAAALRRATG